MEYLVPDKFRDFVERDHDAVLALNALALQGTGAELAEDALSDLTDIGRFYQGAGGAFLVGVTGERVVAMGALLPHTRDVGEIRRMRVSPEFQRLGWGRRLLAALEERAVDLRFLRLELETTSIQLGARRLHETAGYDLLSELKYGSFVVLRYQKELRR
jgi:GNAT superfamily N-acetyltransferase